MRFSIIFLGTELFTFEMVWPEKGMFEVPDFFDSSLYPESIEGDDE